MTDPHPTDPHPTDPHPTDHTVLDFVPALVVVLHARENELGRPLTETEVLEIRDTAACVRVPASVSRALADSRGYDDIDPERAWEQWQEVRRTL